MTCVSGNVLSFRLVAAGLVQTSRADISSEAQIRPRPTAEGTSHTSARFQSSASGRSGGIQPKTWLPLVGTSSA